MTKGLSRGGIRGACRSVGLLAFSLLTIASDSSAQVATRSGDIVGLPNLDRARSVVLDLPPAGEHADDRPDEFELSVRLDGDLLPIRLHRHSLRSPDATLLVDRGNGVLEEMPLPPSRTYRGEIEGEPGSGIAATLDRRGFIAIIERADGTRWHIEPLANLLLDPSAPFGVDLGVHVAYRADEVRETAGVCGNSLRDMSAGMRAARDAKPEAPADGGVAGDVTYLAEIAFDADFEFFQKNGSSVAATVDDIEAVMNQVDFIFDRDVDITYEFTTFVVRTTSADPYTSSDAGTLLCQFRTTWNSAPEVQIQREVAQLYTGRVIDGSTIGIAWLGVVCNVSAFDCGAGGNLGYSLVESRFSGATFNQRIALSAHELGHNWGSEHCNGTANCHIMCASLGGCNGIGGSNLKFGPFAQNAITQYRNSVTCDLALAPPLTVPFLEQWTSTTISTSRWIFNKGGAVNTAATNEPSGPNSLNLDSGGADLYADDEIRSNLFLLGGIPQQLALSYFTQHKGVESGETLTVDYLNSAGDWTTINTIVSNGTSQNDFVFWSHILPANAKHDGFRLRFRVDGNDTGDDWYVDDIRIDFANLPANDECGGALAITQPLTAFDTSTATTSLPAAPIACNEANGQTLVNDLWYGYTAPCTGTLTVATCGLTTLNTRIVVYAGGTCPSAGTPALACNDDGAGCANGTSLVTLPVTAGQTVLIRVGSVSGAGTGTLLVGCEPACPDSDGDGVCDAVDNCPGVPNASQADSDGDGVGDACDGCPNDPLKTSPGACGCGVSDIDSDGDGVPDCNDGCPNDPLKTSPGACGCGVSDIDSDGDGVPDCNDGCPNDPLKIAPGACGCGVSDVDSDSDGVPDCNDGCPNDPLKTSPGVCGCGVSDVDSDGDGVPDCNDGCPNDPLKISPGACGCGVSDIDSDGDGVPDCNDGCPNDPLKIAPGACGCGVSDVDSDSDGVPDCNDGCPNDPLKTEPGACGCGVSDIDSDGDGVPDCNDGCPNDPLKTEPGACGCGVSDIDSDGDGVPDCNDGCPTDPLKTEPGACGCGVSDIDSDGDGVPDCNDGCPTDPLKTEPGACGCGVSDIDSDGDGVPDCNDGCPTDPLKTEPGACGCGVPDVDANGNGTPDCLETPCEVVVDASPTSLAIAACEAAIFTVVASSDEALSYQWRRNGKPLADDDRISGATTAQLVITPALRGDAGTYDVLITAACGTAVLSESATLSVERIEGCTCLELASDSDGDGVDDCNDGCPFDPDKIDPGICGCGAPDVDGDGDGVLDCIDGCPEDPLKSEPGLCGCGNEDFDLDGDGTPDSCEPAACVADFNGDGIVDGGDLAILLGSWGTCVGCPTDLDGNGVIDGTELAILLGAWGACP